MTYFQGFKKKSAIQYSWLSACNFVFACSIRGSGGIYGLWSTSMDFGLLVCLDLSLKCAYYLKKSVCSSSFRPTAFRWSPWWGNDEILLSNNNVLLHNYIFILIIKMCLMMCDIHWYAILTELNARGLGERDERIMSSMARFCLKLNKTNELVFNSWISTSMLSIYIPSSYIIVCTLTCD